MLNLKHGNSDPQNHVFSRSGLKLPLLEAGGAHSRWRTHVGSILRRHGTGPCPPRPGAPGLSHCWCSQSSSLQELPRGSPGACRHQTPGKASWSTHYLGKSREEKLGQQARHADRVHGGLHLLQDRLQVKTAASLLSRAACLQDVQIPVLKLASSKVPSSHMKDNFHATIPIH